GTQRLTHAVGKAKAMDMILTGRMIDAADAERSGLVARVVPAAILMQEAIKAAETIAALSQPSLLAAKEAVNRSFETSLIEGVRFSVLCAAKRHRRRKWPPSWRSACGGLERNTGRGQIVGDASMPGGENLDRYARHIVLHEIGGPGQAALKGARALVIGAGGL